MSGWDGIALGEPSTGRRGAPALPPVGATVRVDGVSRAELNGRVGVVHEHRGDRAAVRVDGAGDFALRGEHLALVAPAPEPYAAWLARRRGPGGGDARRATRVTLRLGFAAPRVASVLFRRSSAIAPFVENRVLAPTLARFRDTLAEIRDGERARSAP